MNEKRLSSPIDHYIQGDILQALYKVDQPVNFTRLKPDGMENSLFMYHMNKLVARKVVEKAASGGFELTKNGARWVNLVDEANLQPTLNPRVLINFILTNEDKILIVHRKGASAQHLNKYLLPGGLLEYGHDLAESSEALMTKRFGSSIQTSFLGTQEVIHRLDDGYSHHTIILLQYGILPSDSVFMDDERYEYTWMEVEKAKSSLEGSPFIGVILDRFINGQIKPFESFVFSL